ncbi:hypothetical protein [Halomonas halocynthiae]|uniref:hypothetical protein n=1 Tax=Halomonas halocynthiae TaxID=176290 RepID=UPI0003FB0680|nr:hypothetical protein [Halomonas halocynthiae]
MEVTLGMQLAKLAVSIGMVLGLAMVAERLSARMAGLLAGYPLGTALALFFIGLEISPTYAAESAVHTLAGFTATLALCGGYLLGARRDDLLGVFGGTAAGLLAWLTVNLALTQISFTRMSGTLTTLIAIIVFTYLYRRLPDIKTRSRGSFSWLATALRAGLAATTILVITGLAHIVPPAWAGVMAAFPFTMFPLLLIVHLTHGRAPVVTIIKHFPAGLGALLSYTLCVSLTYPSLGLALGTLSGFAVATLWLLGWMRIQQWWQARSAAL